MIYYLSPTGNDAFGVGTIASPWRTFYHASQWVNTPGDIVYAFNGTYNEVQQSTFAKGVSVEGESMGGVIVSSLYSNLDKPVFLFSSSSIEDGDQTISYITLKGNFTTGGAIRINLRNNVKVHHCTVLEFKYTGVWFHGTNAAWNTNAAISRTVDCEISNCIVTNCTSRNTGYDGGLIRIEGTDGFHLRSCQLDQRDRALGQNGNIIAGYQNLRLKIHDNDWHKNDYENGEWNFFAEVHYSKGEFEMYRNNFYGAACFDLSTVVKGAYAYGGLVESNMFTTTAPPPVDAHFQAYIDLESFDFENDITVTRNYFRYSRLGVYYNNVQTSGDGLNITSNIFDNVGNAVNTSSSAIKIQSDWDGTDPTPLSNVLIANNLIDCGTASTAGISISVKGTITNMDIRNNIINGQFANPIKFSTNITPTVDTLNINNNFFFGQTSTAINYGAGITYVNRDDSGNLTDNPLLTADFHLQGGSPAIGAGLDLGLTLDYDGDAWLNPPDCGAYQSTSAPPATIQVTDITVTGTGGATTISTDDGTLQMIATVLPVDATDPSVTWSVIAGTGTASISITGLLLALTNGLVTVRATANDGSAVFGELVITLSYQLPPIVKKNIAPAGWHVPSSAEIWTMVQALHPGATWPSNTAGGKMKEVGTTHWNDPNVDATNESGFNGFGVGYRDDLGAFINRGVYMMMWNADEYDATNGRYSSCFVSNGSLTTSGGGGIVGNPKKYGMIIRLIKDDSNDPGSMTDYDGNVYPTVKIGNQVWMAANLAVTHFNDGTPIPNITNDAQWAATTIAAMCWFNNIPG